MLCCEVFVCCVVLWKMLLCCEKFLLCCEIFCVEAWQIHATVHMQQNVAASELITRFNCIS